MKLASDFRSIARNALAGRWGIAVLAGLLAALLGGASSGGANFNFNFNIGESSGDYNQFADMGNIWNEEMTGLILGVAMVVFWIALVVGAVFFVLGSIVSVGYSKFNLDLVDRQKEPEIGTVFGYFSHWKTAVVANLLQGIYIILWTLLFIIPGIVASYSYAMTSYILAEHPELSASEAIDRSKTMMSGNRWRLFCLQLSFIGWDLLAALTFGIGYLWLTPYKQAATAAFYREVSGTEYITATEAPVPLDGGVGDAV